LQTTQPANLLLICAGTFREFALEDGYAAGRLIAELQNPTLSDAASLACWLAEQHAKRPLDCLRKSRNGRALAGKGRDEEVRFCAQESCYNVVPTMQNGVITATHSS
ncbi:MAG: 2-phosphosulfolactate phosphatase, partial [Verrucomicrobiota bacterium]|nr:2-phosphosulfolactate phosphatase [Verrucomicrobiota bacterium]